MIIFVDLFLFILLVALTVAFSSFFTQQGVPIWFSLVLGMITTYFFLTVTSTSLHWLLRMIVGKDTGYLPSWKIPLWGTMAALHYFLFFSLKLFLPQEYLPNQLLKAFGMEIGSGSINMGYILDPEMIIIGDDVCLEVGAILSGHIMSRPDRRVYRSPVIVEDGARIGKNCVIAPGVHIGANAILLPNTFVPTNWTLESGKCYGGNPATKITKS